MIKNIKEIAKILAKMDSIIKQIEEEYPQFVEMDVDWITSEFVSVNKKKLETLIPGPSEDPDYYYEEHPVIWHDEEDNIDFEEWTGSIYFKTEVPGQFVKCHISYGGGSNG